MTISQNINQSIKQTKFITEETKIKLLYYGLIVGLLNLSVICSISYHLLAIKFKLAEKFKFLSFSAKGINFPAVNKDLIPLIIFEWIGIIFTLLMITAYFSMQNKLKALKEENLQKNDDSLIMDSVAISSLNLIKNNKQKLNAIKEISPIIRAKYIESIKDQIAENKIKEILKNNSQFTKEEIEKRKAKLRASITNDEIQKEIKKKDNKTKIKIALSIISIIGISCALRILKSFIREIDFALRFAMENKVSWLFLMGIYVLLLATSIVPRIITFVENDLKEKIEKGKLDDKKKLTFVKIFNNFIILIPVTALIMGSTRLMQKVNFLTSFSLSITVNNNVINILHNKNNLLAMMLFGMILTMLVYDYMDISNKKYFGGLNPLKMFEKMNLNNLSVHIAAAITYSVCTLALISVGQSMKNIPEQDFQTLCVCYLILFMCSIAIFIMGLVQMSQRNKDRLVENLKEEVSTITALDNVNQHIKKCNFLLEAL